MIGFPGAAWPGTAPKREDAGGEKTVVLINSFVVPVPMEDAFLQWWRLSRPFFAAQPGFVSAKLHRSLDEHERYRFVNVAEWRSSEAYRAALASLWSAVPRPRIPGLEWHPALYEVVETA